MSKQLAASPDLLQSAAERKAQGGELTGRAEQADELLAGIPNMLQLQDEDRYWRNLSEQYGSKRKQLTARAATIEEQRRVLDKEVARWQLTYAEIHSTPGLEVVAERVQREVEVIQKAQQEAEHQLKLVLTLQNELGEQEREIAGVLRNLDDARRRIRGNLLQRDSQPLWRARDVHATDQSIGTIVYLSAGRGFTGTEGFLLANDALLLTAVIVYILTLIVAFQIRRAAAGNAALSPEVQRAVSRPYSVALLLTLLMTVGITASAPSGVAFVVCIFYVVPVLRLLPLLVDDTMHALIYASCIFYSFEWLHVVLQSGATLKRGFFALVVLAGVIVFGWLSRASRLRLHEPATWKKKCFVIGVRVGLTLLVVSLLANVFGFVSLAQILGVSTLFSAFTFASLYTVVRVLEFDLEVIVHTSWFQSLDNLRPEGVQRWGARLLVFAVTVVWLNINLYLFTVRDAVVGAMKSALEHPLGFGKVQFALGDALNLLVFLLIGYLLAKAARFVLEEAILSRVSARGGISYAVSRVAYYLLLLGIFVAGITNAGVELNKLTVVTGALGLGVGFGLQNIVNNFASGMIILFERPFRVGDTVEVMGVVGSVKRIGARSSTVQTFQDAEVILPNSTLLSNQVTNWTLTSARRRVEVPVGVAYGVDPERVIKLLTGLAASNPRILSHPAPQAFFLGFGESALNFELRFWAPQALWFELKSDVGMAVYRALTEAGINIPFPQRDLHLRGVEEGATNAPLLVKTSEQIRKKAAGK